jgi:hypothetical protein
MIPTRFRQASVVQDPVPPPATETPAEIENISQLFLITF